MPGALLQLAEADARRVGGHGEGGDALGPGAAGAGEHHQQVGGAGAGDEHLAAADAVAIAVLLGTGAQRGGVRAGIGLGQAVAAELAAGGQQRHPCAGEALLRPGRDHPGHHVVDGDVGGGAGAAGGQLFQDDRGIEPAQPQAAERLRRVQAAKAHLAGPGDGLQREFAGLVPACRVRRHFAAGEAARGVLIGELLFAEAEVHRAVPARDVAAHRRLMVVLMPAETVLSSNQRAVTVLVWV